MRSEIEFEDFVYSAVTKSIRVSARPYYLDEQSSTSEKQYVWAYKIKIENRSKHSVQLLGRHWFITDCNGLSQEVEGSGVVGEQPVIRPGDYFEYSSFASLAAPSGIMAGSYRMAKVDNDKTDGFDVTIPAFSLDSPDQLLFPN